MKMEDHVERLEQANVRIEAMIWIPGAVAAMTVPENLKDLITDDLYGSKNVGQIVSKIPALAPLLSSEDEPDEDLINEVLYSVPGYFAQMARPIPTDFFGEDGHAFSWGYYQTRWVHVFDMEELVCLAELFSEEVVASARKKHQSAA